MIMLPQRARGAVNRVKNRSSNGPRRVQETEIRVSGRVFQSALRRSPHLQRVGIRQLSGICWYPASAQFRYCEPRWHRG
ncbi:MAG: hypothetical protein E7638_04920 [Ruminococcaceae bacterium]|nr:hypothetical protein [Oscillospiraceae bacterium]